MSHTSAPKSSFKALFVGTPLGNILENLKMSKAVPEGFKPQECERRGSRVRPPIPYIPEKEDLNEAGESSATIKPANQGGATGVHVVTQYPRKVPHACPASNAAIKAKGLQEACKRLVQAEKECNKKLEEAVLNRDLTEIEGRDNSVLSKAIDIAKEAQTKQKVQ